MIKKRCFIVGAIVVLIILGIGPVVINLLMFEQDLVKVNGDEALWIPSLATYFGAIVGGVISGLLTLMGVRITIKDSKEKQLQDSLPQKLLDIEDIIFIMERQNELLLIKFKKEQSPSILNPYYSQRIDYIIEYLENDGLLRKSANVNLKTYQVIRRLFNSLKKLQYSKSAGKIYPYEEINKAIAVTISDLKTEREKLASLIGE